MSDSIVSTKKIPIITRDLLPIPADSKRVLTQYNELHDKSSDYVAHNLFVGLLFESLDEDIELPLLPENCIAIDDFLARDGIASCSGADFNGGININPTKTENGRLCFSQGIYFCLREAPLIKSEQFDYFHEIIYVGKTINIEQRFSQHHKKEAFKFLGIDRVIFVGYNPKYYSESDLLWAERQYINMLKPILNDCSASCLTDGNGEDAKNKIVDDFRLIYEQGYQQGVKDGFASAKNQMMDFFDSAIQPPKLK
jgi:hypothetical protein